MGHKNTKGELLNTAYSWDMPKPCMMDRGIPLKKKKGSIVRRDNMVTRRKITINEGVGDLEEWVTWSGQAIITKYHG